MNMNKIKRFAVSISFLVSAVSFIFPAYAATVLSPVEGNNNHVQINDALRKGGVVHLNAGTYVISSTINMRTGTTLQGDRGAKIVVAPDVGWEKYRPVVRFSSVENARMAGFEIDGNRDKNLFPFESAAAAPGHQYYRGFFLYKSKNIEIDHMYLHDFWDDVVFSEKTTNLNFHDNIVRRSGHDIIAIYHSGTTYVTNNCMRASFNSGARVYGNSGPMYLVSNNIGKEENSVSYAGIEVNGSRSTAFDCGNTIHDVATKYGLLNGATIRTGGCPISATISVATASCNVAELAAAPTSTTGTGTGTTGTGTCTKGSSSTTASDSSGSSTDTEVGLDDGTTVDIPASLHVIGGFGAYSDTAMAAVDSVGGNSVMNYVSISGGLDAAHKALNTYANRAGNHGLKLIDDIPDQLIRRYHTDWNMTRLVADMTTHLKFIASNENLKAKLVGYWMIDDWYDNFGKAKTALQKMTSLIHQYTPGKYAICGFTGNTSYGGSVSGYTNFAANFSPSGCDMIGVYLYPWGSGKVPMTNLANILAAMKNNGWDPNKTPLIGIPQSYGGKFGYSVPTAAQVQSQTKYFCQQGAKGIVYYDFNTGTNATTSATVKAGIKAGLADCAKIWGQ
jgi:hypothetical protein